MYPYVHVLCKPLVLLLYPAPIPKNNTNASTQSCIASSAQLTRRIFPKDDDSMYWSTLAFGSSLLVWAGDLCS